MNPMIFHESCPDCGHVLEEGEYKRATIVGFDCPRCKCHYDFDDFCHEMDEKRMAQHHNHATADLSSEEDE